MATQRGAFLRDIAAHLSARGRNILDPETWNGDAWGTLYQSQHITVDWYLLHDAGRNAIEVGVDVFREGELGQPQHLYDGVWTHAEVEQLLQ